jgi:hypothetical protein
VALSADGGTLAVGAYFDESGKGAVYVFVRPGGSWTTISHAAKLTLADGVAGDQFGLSVGLSADGGTLAAGAHGDDSNRGSVHVFVRPERGWLSGAQAAKLTASDREAGDRLGQSVALSADGGTLAAGAPGDDNYVGAVYVFVRPGGGWATATQTAKLIASAGVANDDLGLSVALSADGGTLAAGADADDSYRGSVYVFIRPAHGWETDNQTAKLTASDRAAGDQLGRSVALSADGATLAAGAPSDDGRRGAVYVFVRPADRWRNGAQTAKLIAAGGAPLDELGHSVALGADGMTLAAGARGDDDGRGAIYTFLRPDGGWRNGDQAAKLTASDGVPGAFLGQSVALSADGATLAAGAYGDDGGRGAVYAFAYLVRESVYAPLVSRNAGH